MRLKYDLTASTPSFFFILGIIGKLNKLLFTICTGAALIAHAFGYAFLNTSLDFMIYSFCFGGLLAIISIIAAWICGMKPSFEI